MESVHDPEIDVEIVQVRIHDRHIGDSVEADAATGFVLRGPVNPRPVNDNVIGRDRSCRCHQGYDPSLVRRARNLQAEQTVVIGSAGESDRAISHVY